MKIIVKQKDTRTDPSYTNENRSYDVKIIFTEAGKTIKIYLTMNDAIELKEQLNKIRHASVRNPPQKPPPA